MTDTPSARALSELAAIVGTDSLQSAGTPDTYTIAPRTADDLAPIVTLAAREGIGLLPRSSTGPPRTGRGTLQVPGLSVDLSGLNRILKVDRRNRVAIVEAGVTFPDLQDALEPEGLRITHPLLPPQGKSVVAAFLDREPPLIPKYHWDMTDPLMCAEVYFGTGDRFRTGGAGGPGTTLEEQWDAGMFQKNPLGPAQTDLLKLVQGSQGTLGIATWASIRLEVEPEIRTVLVAASNRFGPLAQLVYGITRRRLGDEILLLDAAALRHLSGALGAPTSEPAHAWTCIVVVGSLPQLPEESMQYQLGEVATLAGESGLQLREGDEVLSQQLMTSLLGARGPSEPWKTHAKGTFRELQFLATLDHAETLATLARERWQVLGVDPAHIAVYVQPINQGRTCHVEVTAFLDPAGDLAVTIDAALPALVTELANNGAFFSRPTPAIADAVYARCPDTVRGLRTVKDVLDPAGILNPGALCFSADEAA